MSTNKYLITHGKHSRWEDVSGVQTQVIYKPGDIIEMSLEQAQERQQSVRLATIEDIAAYELRIRGDVQPPIPDTHVSTAGSPPAPTPAVDPLQTPATAEQPAERHFPAPVAPIAPAAAAPPEAPAAQPVVQPAAVAAPPTPAAPAQTTSKADVKPRARTSAKKTAGKPRSRR